MVTLSSILRFAGIGGRFSLGHPMTWLVITLLCLGIGYAWLSTYASGSSGGDDRSTVRKLTNSEMLTTIEENVETVEKQAEMLITRADDDARAAEFLEYEALQAKILPLLDRADIHFENEQYVVPAGDNAWEDYQAILALSPGESVAIAGQTKIKSRLLANAEQAIDDGDIAAAEGWLVQLDVIQSGDAAQQDLREEIKQLVAIETERKLKEQEEASLRKKIETTLEQAAAENEKADKNFNKARDLYDRVLELDPGNQAATAGLTELSDEKLDAVELALRGDDLQLAQRELRLATAIYPKNRRISGLELALGASLKQQLQERLQAQEQKKQELLAKQAQQAIPPPGPDPGPAQKSEPVVVPQPTSPPDTEPEKPLATGVIAQARQSTGQTAKAVKPAYDQKALANGIAAYYNGDYNKSFEILYPLAQEGVARAQFRIGIMYQFGRSVARNTDLAEKWFTEALPELLRKAQEGIAWAQTDLGTAYEFGISLQQDFERAAYWYQLAADQGYPGAQTNLGVLYAQGDGVSYNRAQAIFWFRKAAENGDRVAKENLAILGAAQ